MNEQTNPQEPGTDPDFVEQHGSEEQVPLESGSVPHVKRVLEAALLSSPDPLTVQQLKRLFAGQVDADNIRKVLDELKDEWAERSIELTTVASGWRFRVKPQYQEFLDRITHEKPPRYSRAVLETLAIVAYRQPVTRGDIEDIRGVAVSPPTLKALEERGWIEPVGYRETPEGLETLFLRSKVLIDSRAAGIFNPLTGIWGNVDDLNLRSLEELPPLEDIQSALEPAPTLVTLAAAPKPEQESLIDEPETPENDDSQEQRSHA